MEGIREAAMDYQVRISNYSLSALSNVRVRLLYNKVPMKSIIDLFRASYRLAFRPQGLNDGGESMNLTRTSLQAHQGNPSPKVPDPCPRGGSTQVGRLHVTQQQCILGLVSIIDRFILRSILPPPDQPLSLECMPMRQWLREFHTLQYCPPVSLNTQVLR